jgi:hypothetical protein
MKRDINALRDELCDFIRIADEKKVNALHDLLENEMVAQKEWWQDLNMVQEMEARYEALESGADKGVSLEELKKTISENKKKKYGA